MTDPTPTVPVGRPGAANPARDGSWTGPPVEMRLAMDALPRVRALAAVGRASDAWFALGAGFGVLAFGASTAGDVVPTVLFAAIALACLVGAGEIPGGWSGTGRQDGTSGGAVAVLDGDGVVIVDGSQRRELPWSSIGRAVETGDALVVFVSRTPIVLETASVPPAGLDAVRTALRSRGLLARSDGFRRPALTLALLAAMLAYGVLALPHP